MQKIYTVLLMFWMFAPKSAFSVKGIQNIEVKKNLILFLTTLKKL
ncbi:hypothetical protein HCUR_01577 [Holospora curviuscula]|uniref:Uncharacterized protein n=1 Tax=Holospora curviuscula TaxID=1082868 RepID=A0A2S5R6P1_9PROT|nr:hypothetical protein HCUR_01577 [Holospora curviuscula]